MRLRCAFLSDFLRDESPVAPNLGTLAKTDILPFFTVRLSVLSPILPIHAALGKSVYDCGTEERTATHRFRLHHRLQLRTRVQNIPGLVAVGKRKLLAWGWALGVRGCRGTEGQGGEEKGPEQRQHGSSRYETVWQAIVAFLPA